MCYILYQNVANEFNLVNSLLTNDTKNMLHEMSTKKIILKDNLEILNKKSIFDAKKTKLIFKYWIKNAKLIKPIKILKFNKINFTICSQYFQVFISWFVKYIILLHDLELRFDF